MKSGLALVEQSEDSASSGFRLHAGLKARSHKTPFRNSSPNMARRSIARGPEFIRFFLDLSAARSLALLGAALTAALLLFVGFAGLPCPFRCWSPPGVVRADDRRRPSNSSSRPKMRRRLRRPSRRSNNGSAGSQTRGRRGAPEALDWDELRLEAVAFEHRMAWALGAIFALKRPMARHWRPVGRRQDDVGRSRRRPAAAGAGSQLDGQALHGAMLERWRACSPMSARRVGVRR